VQSSINNSSIDRPSDAVEASIGESRAKPFHGQVNSPRGYAAHYCRHGLLASKANGFKGRVYIYICVCVCVCVIVTACLPLRLGPSSDAPANSPPPHTHTHTHPRPAIQRQSP
jgi:hypothetical protein